MPMTMPKIYVPGGSPEDARQAEAAGADGVFVGDHVTFYGSGSDALIKLTGIAAVTTKLELQTCVYLLALRHPTPVALQAAQLEGADLRACRLANADLRGINLKGARLNYADLRDCNLGPLALENGRMIPSALDKADARHADFRGANLQRAAFRGANLSAANLTGAKLDGADWREANLFGARKSIRQINIV